MANTWVKFMCSFIAMCECILFPRTILFMIMATAAWLTFILILSFRFTDARSFIKSFFYCLSKQEMQVEVPWEKNANCIIYDGVWIHCNHYRNATFMKDLANFFGMTSWYQRQLNSMATRFTKQLFESGLSDFIGNSIKNIIIIFKDQMKFSGFLILGSMTWDMYNLWF